MEFDVPHSTLVGSNVKIKKHMVNYTMEPVPIWCCHLYYSFGTHLYLKVWEMLEDNKSYIKSVALRQKYIWLQTQALYLTSSVTLWNLLQLFGLRSLVVKNRNSYDIPFWGSFCSCFRAFILSETREIVSLCIESSFNHYYNKHTAFCHVLISCSFPEILFFLSFLATNS